MKPLWLTFKKPVETTTAGSEEMERVGGKYLTLVLGEECYGVEILKVQEIISVPQITRVPRCPPFVKGGVVNLRGRIIPVVELRSKLDLSSIEYNEKACIVVLNLKFKERAVAVGTLGDTVVEVFDFKDADIEPTPEALATNTAYIRGIGRRENSSLCLLLDIDRLLSADEVQGLAQDDWQQ